MPEKQDHKESSGVAETLQTSLWIARELPIRFLGDPVLRVVCESINESEFGQLELEELADRLKNTLKKYRQHTGTGRGLAANQIGEAKRVVVMWTGEEPEVFVNPVLVSSEGEGSYEESCISSGAGLIGQVIRPWTGQFEYRDLAGDKHVRRADEKQTRLFLHEIDHLDGIVCTDKYEPKTMRIVSGGKGEILGAELKRLT